MKADQGTCSSVPEQRFNLLEAALALRAMKRGEPFEPLTAAALDAGYAAIAARLDELEVASAQCKFDAPGAS